MLYALLKQQAIGVMRYVPSFVLLYYLLPDYFFCWYSICLWAVLTGSYLAYAQYKAAFNLQNVLKYEPAGLYQENFKQEITKCGMQPDAICLRYSYLNDAIASATFNLISIDPLIWKDIEGDDQAVAVNTVLALHVLPTIDASIKELHAKIKEAITPAAQRFIFRHELGHVFYNYSYKRIALVGIIATVVIASALAVAGLVMPQFGGYAALLVGMLAGGSLDLLLTYASNLWFKVAEETKADLFAAQFSSSDELNAAADFFEQYAQAAQMYRTKTQGLMAYVPSSIMSGHPDGSRRAHYLRGMAQSQL